MSGLVVAGIGTGIGKTIVSSVIVQSSGADYWKPIQSGNLRSSDTHTVQKLCTNNSVRFHKEAYRFKLPASPHAAAVREQVEIELKKLKVPKTTNNLIIELAGGIMVPLNDSKTNLDLLKGWKLPVVLVSQNYLGSINHTLLSADILRANNIYVSALVFNGKPNKQSEEAILKRVDVQVVLRMKDLKTPNIKNIRQEALRLNEQIRLLFQ